MSVTSSASATHVRLHTVEPPERIGGETRPYEYPHLYQIQAGDWRISYAVERNRLAILVLEVLNADGTIAPDPVRESLTRKMKVKLLDWPEGSPSRELRPDDIGKKVKIRLLDMAEERGAVQAEVVVRPKRVRLGAKAQGARSVIRLEEPQPVAAASTEDAGGAEATDPSERRVTPLDSPTM
ncbi:MAG TPA: hypothetical protein VFH29_06485 [Anaerolineales bacterium]|nr:hypothetical protein [Anaerolineales bacterium]